MIWSCPSRTSSPSIQPPKRLKRMLLCNGSAAIVDNENYKHNLSNANNAMFVRSITSIIILACIWGYVNLHNSMFSLVHNSPALAALNLWWLKLIVETKHATMRQDCVDALPRSRWCSCSCFPTFSECAQSVLFRSCAGWRSSTPYSIRGRWIVAFQAYLICTPTGLAGWVEERNHLVSDHPKLQLRLKA